MLIKSFPKTEKRSFKRIIRHNRAHGGAAIEYIIVSTFATLFAISASMYAAKIVKEKMSKIEAKIGVKFDDPSSSIFE